MSFIDDLKEPFEKIVGAYKKRTAAAAPGQSPLTISAQEIEQLICLGAKIINAACGTQGCGPVEKPKTKFAYGFKRQKPDHRDFKFSKPIFAAADLPEQSEILTATMPPVFDQGQLGSCTANAGARTVQYLCLKGNYPWKFTPSRLFLYFNERLANGDVLQDSGANIRDIFKALNTSGICPEAEGDGTKPNWIWPYSDGPIKFRLPPPHQCYEDAVLHKALKYEAVPQDLNAIKSAIVQGFLVSFGIDIYQSFEDDAVIKSGVVPMPDKTQTSIGGHALDWVGYMPTAALVGRLKERNLPIPDGMSPIGYLVFDNSWGTSYGDNGRGYLPYEYALDPDLASDFWACELIGHA